MFNVKVFGCRGSFPTCGGDYVAFGGNTTCVEVRCGDELIVLDAGTGIIGCGKRLIAEGRKNIRLLFTHVHWDHIQGFPFFASMFIPDVKVDIYCGNLYGRKRGVEDVLKRQMTEPEFPVSIDEVMRASSRYTDFRAGEEIAFGDVRVLSAPLNHPQGATGYRIEYMGKVFAFVTDTEHVVGKVDENVVGLMEGADYAIYDACYDDKEFPSKVGWGHSTWEHGVELARLCRVKRLGIFHHDPAKTDRILEARDVRIKRVAGDLADTVREGDSIDLCAKASSGRPSAGRVKKAAVGGR